MGPIRFGRIGFSSLKDILAKAEKHAIEIALHEANGNKQEAAKLLEIGKTSLYEKCKTYGIK